MIPDNKKPLSGVLRKEQELSRIAHREYKWHYAGAYRAQPIFRIKESKSGSPPLAFSGVDSGSSLCNQTLRLRFWGSRVQMRLPPPWIQGDRFRPLVVQSKWAQNRHLCLRWPSIRKSSKTTIRTDGLWQKHGPEQQM